LDKLEYDLRQNVVSHMRSKGYLEARTGEPQVEEVSQTSISLTFDVDEGDRVRVVDIQFEGNTVFSDGDLRGSMKLVKEAGLISRFKGQDILHLEKLEYDLGRNVVGHMRSKGYLEARTGEPRVEGVGPRRTGFPVLPLPLLSSVDEGLRITVPVTEGKLYRLGEIKIEGNSIYSEDVIRQVIGLRPGEIANAQRIVKALSEDLDKLYGRAGFIQYEYDINPTFKPDPQRPQEGIADFTITITEGKQFSLRRLEFAGNTYTRDNVLRREVAVNEGDIFDQTLWEYSVLRLNQLGFFDPIDKEKDANFRTDEERGEVEIELRVAERGRNQIAFNGGVSGIGGSFFGLEYSTNNLLGRGESLSFQFAFGNRQRSILFSFTEPYVKDRPISIGFTAFTESRKFFGEGTILSENLAALAGITNPIDFFNVSEENLFTQNTTGGSLFASAPLWEFWKPRSSRLVRIARSSRIGLSYSISQSSIEDPPVNEQDDRSSFIPVVFDQPSILTSRVTPSFVFDTRNGSIDPTEGQQVTFQLAFAGAGGDVRTYQPSVSFMRFMPVRRKRSENPEVFGFRLVAGHVGSFGITEQVRRAQETSLSFINGVPIYERFFLGDEFSIRGYNVRSIGPVVPLEVYVTTRGVRASAVPLGDEVVDIPGLSESLRERLATLGTFTGPTGANPVIVDRSFRLLGGDTQLLGNFEYRVPIFGPLQLAAFADIGSAFNLRTKTDQIFSTEFLPDQPFISRLGGINGLVRLRNPQLAASQLTGALLVQGDRLLTRDELQALVGAGSFDPATGLPLGVQSVFLRATPTDADPTAGVQTNTVARISQSLFSKLGDYRSSLGAELRIQLPVVNVPFRFIYAYNPNAKVDFLGEKRRTFRFSIGRTF
ncbi:MAG TPA: BamA/TamA family outer membrane protein, partial [Pyrinomonadaceae bacterium]|nr:BamA/TamA family outer membrane protein [Pyrinomonadaceae bacterium]